MNMRKYLVLVLVGLLFVSCASTGKVETEEKTLFIPNVPDGLFIETLTIKEDAELRKLFDKFNKLYFNNYLKVECIGYMAIEDARCTDGTYIGGFATDFFYNGHHTAIVVGPRKNAAPTTTFEGILLHEMVHMLFYQRGEGYEDHGPNFQYKVDKLNEITNYKYKIYNGK